jgi:hypothetical protein
MTQKVLIENKEEWIDFIEMVTNEEADADGDFFVKHDLMAEFCMYAVRRASIKSFVGGVVSTLVFVVLLGYSVKLLS